MSGVVEIAVMLLIIGAIALLAAPWIMRRRGAGSDWVPGTLLVTGVSPRPDGVTGEQYVTITGVINGPTVDEYVVYARLAVDVNEWPTMGALMDVIYSPKNPEKWGFGRPPEPLPPNEPNEPRGPQS